MNTSLGRDLGGGGSGSEGARILRGDSTSVDKLSGGRWRGKRVA